MVDQIAIAPIGDIATATTPRKDSSTKCSDAIEEHPNAIEPLHLDEEDATVRTKLRTYAIVLALYLVLFLAALDQTIIA